VPELALDGAETPDSMVERTAHDEPMWDQPEVHDVYRRWHQVLADYDGDRMTVAEAWTQSPESMAKFVRADEMSQAFNFSWLLAPWSAKAFATVVTGTLAALRDVDAPPTWVLSNHDVVRHPTRYGGGATGIARGRAATLTMLGLPGSCYLYQGEELGLERSTCTPTTARTRRGSGPARRAATAAGCRSRGPATHRRTTSGRGPATRGCRSPRTGPR
jgi:alpha-glucosidase